MERTASVRKRDPETEDFITADTRSESSMRRRASVVRICGVAASLRDVEGSRLAILFNGGG